MNLTIQEGARVAFNTVSLSCGSFLGKSVAVISLNAVPVVAAIVCIAAACFGAYKAYESYKSLQAQLVLANQNLVAANQNLVAANQLVQSESQGKSSLTLKVANLKNKYTQIINELKNDIESRDLTIKTLEEKNKGLTTPTEASDKGEEVVDDALPYKLRASAEVIEPETFIESDALDQQKQIHD